MKGEQQVSDCLSTLVSIIAMLGASAYHPRNLVWEVLLQHLRSYVCLVNAGKYKHKQIISTVQPGSTEMLPFVFQLIFICSLLCW